MVYRLGLADGFCHGPMGPSVEEIALRFTGKKEKEKWRRQKEKKEEDFSRPIFTSLPLSRRVWILKSKYVRSEKELLLLESPNIIYSLILWLCGSR